MRAWACWKLKPELPSAWQRSTERLSTAPFRRAHWQPSTLPGIFTADGAGHTTSTLDENVGVGTINVLQLGVGGSATYTLTTQPAPYDPAQVGEYTLSDGTTIYAIAPGRFVLLNPGPVSTSQYIALLF